MDGRVVPIGVDRVEVARDERPLVGDGGVEREGEPGLVGREHELRGRPDVEEEFGVGASACGVGDMARILPEPAGFRRAPIRTVVGMCPRSDLQRLPQAPRSLPRRPLRAEGEPILLLLAVPRPAEHDRDVDVGLEGLVERFRHMLPRRIHDIDLGESDRGIRPTSKTS